MEIIDTIMMIQDLCSLRILEKMARRMLCDSVKQIPVRLDEFIELLDMPMIIRLYDLFKNEEDGYIANDQMKELLSRMIDRYTGTDGEEEIKHEAS